MNGTASNGDSEPTLGRRGFLRAGTGAAVATAGLAVGSGSAAAAYDGWLDDVDNYEGTHDYTDEEEVHVEVGAGDGLLFDPPAILIDPGTTVVWEWTGEGGDHDVSEIDDAFASDLTAEAGHTFEFTFDDEETYRYVCSPHEAVDMKGVVAVGDTDDELIDPAGNGEADDAEGEADDAEGEGDDEAEAGLDLSSDDLVAVALGLGMSIALLAAGLGIVNLDAD